MMEPSFEIRGNINNFDFPPISNACIYQSLDPYNSRTEIFPPKTDGNKSVLELNFTYDRRKNIKFGVLAIIRTFTDPCLTSVLPGELPLTESFLKEDYALRNIV